MAMGLIYFVVILVIFGFVAQIVDIVQSVSAETYERLNRYLQETLSDLTLGQIFQKSFYVGFLQGLRVIVQDDLMHAGDLIKTTLVLDLAVILGAAALAQQLCRFAMRRAAAGEKSLRGLAAVVVRYLISIGFGYLAAYLGTKWIFNAVFVLAAYLILEAVENLFSTWIIHFREYAIGGFLRFSASARLVLSEFALMAFDVVLLIAIGGLTDAIVAVLIGLPLFAYTFAVMDVTAVDYYRSLQERGKLLLRSQIKERAAEKKSRRAHAAIALEQILDAERAPATQTVSAKNIVEDLCRENAVLHLSEDDLPTQADEDDVRETQVAAAIAPETAREQTETADRTNGDD